MNKYNVTYVTKHNKLKTQEGYADYLDEYEDYMRFYKTKNYDITKSFIVSWNDVVNIDKLDEE